VLVNKIIVWAKPTDVPYLIEVIENRQQCEVFIQITL